MKLEIAVMTTLFFVAVYMGYTWAGMYPESAKAILDEFTSSFEFIKNIPHYLIFVIIFVNNSVKALISLVLGILFGLVPIFFVFINGFLIGVVLNVKGAEMGLSKVVVMLLPHGILEIPAVILACSYGLWLGFRVLDRVRGKNVNLAHCLKRAFESYLRIVLPTLLIAALIETYVTPLVAYMFSLT